MALVFSLRKGGIPFTIPHALRSPRQVSGHDFTGAPGKPAFGLLGWLVRLARSERSERGLRSRAEKLLKETIPYAVGSRAAAPS
jgi:hypothetical protein